MGDDIKINFPNDNNGKQYADSLTSYWDYLSKDVAKSIIVWGRSDYPQQILISNMPPVSTFGDKIVCEPDALRVSKLEEVEPKELNPTMNMTAERFLAELDAMKRPITKAFNGQSKFTPDKPLDIDPELFNQAIKNYVESYEKKHPGKKSVLADKGADFLKAANEYDMVQEKCKRKFVNPDKKHANPFLLAGIAMHESACGTSDKATDGRNNIGGFAKMSFSSVEESIYYLGGLIELNRKKGRETVSTLAHSGAYCAKSVADGKNGWISLVSRHANDIRAEYNRLFEEKYSKK